MPDPHLRAADADREAVASALGSHMAAGRLTLAEYDDRVTRAWAARTYGDLTELTADLPAPTPAAGSARWSAVATGSLPGLPAWPTCGPSWGHGPVPPEHSWRSWLATSVTVLVVYLVISVATWELHHFWPMWVIGPWGAALLAQRVTGAGRVDTAGRG